MQHGLVPSHVEQILSYHTDVVDLANRLELRGQENLRYCPNCQPGFTNAAPILRLESTAFQCPKCQSQGDALGLIKFARKCSTAEACEWISEQFCKFSVTQQDGAAERPAPVALYDAEPQEVLEAYLAECRKVRGPVLEMLVKAGLPEHQLDQFGVRYYPKDGRALLEKMVGRYGRRAMLACGLLRDQPVQQVPTKNLKDASNDGLPDMLELEPKFGPFDPYYDARVPFLVIPYRKQGHTIYIKARPLAGHARLGRLGVPLQLGTDEQVPTLFNVDIVTFEHEILLMRRELDAMAATAAGLAAVACSSLSHFRGEWASLLRDKHVTLVLDEIHRKDPRVETVESMFHGAGLAPPERLFVPSDIDRLTYLQQVFADRLRPSARPNQPNRPATATRATVANPNVIAAAASPALASDIVSAIDGPSASASATGPGSATGIGSATGTDFSSDALTQDPPTTFRAPGSPSLQAPQNSQSAQAQRFLAVVQLTAHRMAILHLAGTGPQAHVQWQVWGRTSEKESWQPIPDLCLRLDMATTAQLGQVLQQADWLARQTAGTAPVLMDSDTERLAVQDASGPLRLPNSDTGDEPVEAELEPEVEGELDAEDAFHPGKEPQLALEPDLLPMRRSAAVRPDLPPTAMAMATAREMTPLDDPAALLTASLEEDESQRDRTGVMHIH